MFSFLRKPKPDNSAPAPKKPAPAPVVAAKTEPQAAPETTASQPQAAANEEIVVFESISAAAGSAVEEAAVYYANNMADQAIASLSHYLHDHPNMKEMQPWLMLFDLYQLQGNKPAFNELSMQFVVKFERSAPIWKAPAASAPTKKSDTGQQKDLLTLGNRLAAGPQLEKICQLAQGSTNARVNLNDVAEVELDGCKLMQEGLSSCRKKGKIVQLEGADHMIEVLKKQIAADGHGNEDRLAWLLLFELYQWLGKEAEYEELAIEYAVSFEISPPAWEAVKPALAAAQAKIQSEPASKPAEADDVFAMNGVISEASQSQLQDLSNYAADKQEVRINLAGVTRVDFVAVGNFMGTLINLTQAGKKVLILEANEMVQALFHMMGVSEFATLIRKKAG